MVDNKSGNQPADTDTVMCSRVFNLLQAVSQVPDYGTVWRIREETWKTMIPGYDQSSTRSEHPGLSILRGGLRSPWQAVPMLHGCSGSRGPLVVSGLSPDRAPDYATSFGRVAPVGFDLNRFKSAARRNAHKPVLSDAETKQLDAWMRKRGLA